MKGQKKRSTSSTELLAKRIVKILKDPDNFTNEKEEEMKMALARAYREFVKEHGFGILNVEARGMRTGMNAFCNYPPEDYAVDGNGGPMLEIWVGRHWDEDKEYQVKRVIIRIADNRFELGEELKRLIHAENRRIKTSVTKAKEYKKMLRQFGEQLTADVREFDPH